MQTPTRNADANDWLTAPKKISYITIHCYIAEINQEAETFYEQFHISIIFNNSHHIYTRYSDTLTPYLLPYFFQEFGQITFTIR